MSQSPQSHIRDISDSSDQLAPPSEESEIVGECVAGSLTRLFSNGEVKMGGERRTISIDGCDLYLII